MSSSPLLYDPQQAPVALGSNVVPNQPDGSPPPQLGPGQIMYVESESNSGAWPSGSGGNINIPNVGSFWWSAPWGCFAGVPFCKPGAGTSQASGFTVATVSGGPDFFGPGNNACTSAVAVTGCGFSFGITNGDIPAPNGAQLVGGQALSRGVATKNSISTSGGGSSYTLKLGDDGNLVVLQTNNGNNVVWASNT